MSSFQILLRASTMAWVNPKQLPNKKLKNKATQKQQEKQQETKLNLWIRYQAA